MRDEDIVAAARAIRADRALSVDSARLDELLARADAGERVADEILTLVATDPQLRVELARRVPQDLGSPRGGDPVAAYADLPGDNDPSMEIVYQCSACGYEYPIFEVGEPVPEGCPQGHSPLIRKG